MTGNELVIGLSGANLIALMGTIATLAAGWGRMTEKLSSISQKLECLPGLEQRIRELETELAAHTAASGDRRHRSR